MSLDVAAHPQALFVALRAHGAQLLDLFVIGGGLVDSAGSQPTQTTQDDRCQKSEFHVLAHNDVRLNTSIAPPRGHCDTKHRPSAGRPGWRQPGYTPGHSWSRWTIFRCLCGARLQTRLSKPTT